MSPYKITEKHIPAPLLDKLNQGMSPNQTQRSGLLRTIFDDVVKSTYYPNTQQYSEIVSAILSRWPNLKGTCADGDTNTMVCINYNQFFRFFSPSPFYSLIDIPCQSASHVFKIPCYLSGIDEYW